MSTTDEEKLRKEINCWREEALIAEEQGDEEQARKYFDRAEAAAQKLALVVSPSPVKSPQR